MIAPYEDGRAGPFSVQRVKDSPSSWVSQCFESALVVAGSSHGACSSPSSYRSTTFLPCAYGFQCLAQCIITTNKQVIKPYVAMHGRLCPTNSCGSKALWYVLFK